MQDNLLSHQGDLLIVDDKPDNLRVLSSTLSNHGYRVRAVKNGAMALLGAKAAPPEVILLDIRMPEMDGFEVCRQLKSDPQLCNIPIIFLSASDEIEDKAKAFEVGGVDYITKPFQAVEVLARVKNQLTIQQLKQQVVTQQQQLEQLTAVSSNPPRLNRDRQPSREILEVIVTLVDCSRRFSQAPAIDPEITAVLKLIEQNGQTLLDWVNAQYDGVSC